MKAKIKAEHILRGRGSNKSVLVVESVLPNGDLKIKGTLGPPWTLSKKDAEYYDHFPTGTGDLHHR